MAQTRKLLTIEEEVSSLEGSLILAALPKGTNIPTSSPTDAGRAVVMNGGNLIALPLLHMDWILQSSLVPELAIRLFHLFA
ncbi:hypothetical protein U1Q18_024286 [Sarracenia purpurea var. burkii]